MNSEKLYTLNLLKVIDLEYISSIYCLTSESIIKVI